MEPLFFKAENQGLAGNLGGFEVFLQWSRFFSKRKIQEARAGVRQFLRPSMEPLFFKAENKA